MNLSEDVDLEEFVTAKDDLSGADIKAVCTEAGLLALRERRMRVTKADLETAREKVSLIGSFSESFCQFFTRLSILYLSVPFASLCQDQN
jgi:ATP-dependent 26S proteasome regulatory subunit